VVSIQYTHLEKTDFYTIVSNCLDFYPGDRQPGPYQDPFLRDDYRLNYFRSFTEANEAGERMELVRIEVVQDEMHHDINWDAIKMVTVGDAARRDALMELLQEEFARIDDRLADFTPRGGRA